MMLSSTMHHSLVVVLALLLVLAVAAMFGVPAGLGVSDAPGVALADEPVDGLTRGEWIGIIGCAISLGGIIICMFTS